MEPSEMKLDEIESVCWAIAYSHELDALQADVMIDFLRARRRPTPPPQPRKAPQGPITHDD